MGKFDNRSTPKKRKRKGQQKLKDRLARKAEAARQERGGKKKK